MSPQRTYPDAVPQPCNECPWRREAVPGHLGPYTPLDWIKIAHGEAPIACHKTIVVQLGETTGNWDEPHMRQCRGAAIFRENVTKNPRNPSIATGPADTETCFGDNDEFIEHHGGDPMQAGDIYGPLSTETVHDEFDLIEAAEP